jgi:uncharacterized protein (DUF2249 family)
MTAAMPFAVTIDARAIPPQQRHALIFGEIDALPPGASLLLLNDHDPVPLRRQLEHRAPGAFDWSYLHADPGHFRVKITRRAAAANEDSCCSGGACCG